MKQPRSSQKVSDNPGSGAVTKLAVLADSGLAGKIKYHQVTLDLNVFRPQRGKPIAAVFICIDLATGPDKTHR